jgi:hypothetical protein
MTKTIAKNERVFLCRAEATRALDPSRVVENKDSKTERKVPLFIPADEAYYWSSQWQRDVRNSMEALREGEFEEFNSDDPTDAARWLLSVDEDDCV